MKVQLVSYTKGVNKYENLTIEEIISAIARHGVIKDDNGKLVKYLMDNKHWSPLDMVNISFEIETSRAVGRQLLRHWSLKPQEASQRYSEVVDFEPIRFRKEHKTKRQSSTDSIADIFFTPDYYIIGYDKDNGNSEKIEIFMEKVAKNLKKTQRLYKKGLDLGIAKETMRMILPECASTTLTFNGSLRSWLTFLNVRMDHHAQKECRDIAEKIGEELEKLFPNIFSVIDWKKGMFI